MTTALYILSAQSIITCDVEVSDCSDVILRDRRIKTDNVEDMIALDGSRPGMASFRGVQAGIQFSGELMQHRVQIVSDCEMVLRRGRFALISRTNCP